MTPKLFYKEKTSVSLNSILISNEYLKTNSKRIPSIIKFLNHILAWNVKDNGSSSITHNKWYDRFGGDYTLIKNALENLDLLECDYIWRSKYTNSAMDLGKCYNYQLTSKCHLALADTNKEYFYLLQTDKRAILRNQNNISKRGYNKLAYAEPCMQSIKSTIDNIVFPQEEIERITSKMTPEKYAYTWSLLVNIERRDYKELKHNEKDNRIPNPYTQLPAEIKSIITINGWRQQRVLDIRSCYASLWAEYIFPLSNQSKELQAERIKYNNVFLIKENNPKTYLSKLLDIAKDDIKDVLIQYFNGKRISKDKSNPFYKFNQWIKTEFPTLYSIWIKTDISQTGNNIGKNFETKLMLDASIYNKAKELDIILGYENDGFSLYAEDDSNCQELLEYIEQRSIELLGIKLIFIDKAKKEETLDIQELAEENNNRMFKETKEKWLSVCRNTFKKGAKPDWDHFAKQKQNFQRIKQLSNN